MKNKEIKVGDRFGKLVVINLDVENFVLPSGQTNRAAIVRCDCGNVYKVRYHHVKRGRTKSCGCLRYVHDNIKPSKSNQYIRKVYRSMQERVAKNAIDSHIYYDRGIGISKEWLNNYKSFYDWAVNNNLRKGKQIDRIDNNKSYSPENCRVVSPKKNQRNKRNNIIVKWNNKKVPLVSLVRRKGMFKHYDSVKGRIKRGWSVEKAVDTPIRKGNYERNGRTKNNS